MLRLLLTTSNPPQPEIRYFHPKEIKLIQPNIGVEIDAIVCYLRAGVLGTDDFPPIRVVEYKGTLYSMDTKRLAAFSIAGFQQIPVHMVSLEDPEIAAEFFRKWNSSSDGKSDATVAPTKEATGSSDASSGNVNPRPSSPTFWKERAVGKQEEKEVDSAINDLSRSVGSRQRRTYVPSPKHGMKTRGNISPAPKNGQDVLDNSIQIKSASSRRIGIDPETHEYVVFDQTRGNEYHGHSRTWDQLTQEMKQVFIDSGLVTKKGKLTC